MRRCSIVVAIAAGGLVLCVSAQAASKTYYTSGRRGKAPYISVTVSGGKVTTVDWLLEGQCTPNPTHLNARIKRNGRFNDTIGYGGGGVIGGTHIWGRLNGSMATVTVDSYLSGESIGVCDYQHTFHPVDRALPSGRG